MTGEPSNNDQSPLSNTQIALIALFWAVVLVGGPLLQYKVTKDRFERTWNDPVAYQQEAMLSAVRMMY